MHANSVQRDCASRKASNPYNAQCENIVDKAMYDVQLLDSHANNLEREVAFYQGYVDVVCRAGSDL
jgi:hypothetical protein